MTENQSVSWSDIPRYTNSEIGSPSDNIDIGVLVHRFYMTPLGGLTRQ